MTFSSDGKYKLFADCANDAATGATVAVWNASNHSPNSNYPNTATFLAQYGSQIPAPETSTTTPDWSGFRVAMLKNSGYQRITLAANLDNNGRLAVTRVETAMSMDSPNLQVIEVLWEMVITALPPLSKPTATEIGQLNALATANSIPFSFKADGKIQL